MQRRLAVVDVPFGHDADQIVGVEINRIRIGCRNIQQSLEPSQDRPWTGPEKILTADRGERGLETGVADLRDGQNLPRIGRPDDGEFALPVHLSAFRAVAASLAGW